MDKCLCQNVLCLSCSEEIKFSQIFSSQQRVLLTDSFPTDSFPCGLPVDSASAVWLLQCSAASLCNVVDAWKLSNWLDAAICPDTSGTVLHLAAVRVCACWQFVCLCVDMFVCVGANCLRKICVRNYPFASNSFHLCYVEQPMSHSLCRRMVSFKQAN